MKDEKLKEYILFLLKGMLGKEYHNFGHDWGQQFKHDEVYVALSLLIKYFEGTDYDKERIIEWLEVIKFHTKEFKRNNTSFDKNLYLMMNLYTAIYNSQKEK